LTLPSALQQITLSGTSSYRLLGIEQHDSTLGLLIDLQPFKVTRIALDIAPAFVLATPWGYILADHHSQVVLLDQEGQRIGSFEIPGTPTIANHQLTAIAAFDRSGLLIATWAEQEGVLYTLDLQNYV
jgi:hypothetical protein